MGTLAGDGDDVRIALVRGTGAGGSPTTCMESETGTADTKQANSVSSFWPSLKKVPKQMVGMNQQSRFVNRFCMDSLWDAVNTRPARLFH